MAIEFSRIGEQFSNLSAKDKKKVIIAAVVGLVAVVILVWQLLPTPVDRRPGTAVGDSSSSSDSAAEESPQESPPEGQGSARLAPGG